MVNNKRLVIRYEFTRTGAVSKYAVAALFLGVFALSNSACAQDKAPTKAPGVTCAEKASGTAGSKAAGAKNSGASQKPDAKAAGPTTGQKQVLDPSKFFGKAAAGYAAAKQIPEICAKLFCYCGCDLTDLHNNLLDCFVCQHGVDCDICQDEAIHALRMKKEGKSTADIQKFIDTQFGNQYPFSEPSATLKKYRATRLYKPEKASAAPSSIAGAASNRVVGSTSSSTETASSANPSSQDSIENTTAEKANATKATSGKPTLKPGFKVGACCGNSRKRG